MRAVETFNCSCCNADGAKTEKGVIEAGKLFAYVNLYTQYVKRCDGEYVIPYAYRTKRTISMSPKTFKKSAKIHMICPRCFLALFFMMRLPVPRPLTVGVPVSIKSSKMYYQRIMASKQEYLCTTCREIIPVCSPYARFGIFQSGCTCMSCIKIFQQIE